MADRESIREPFEQDPTRLATLQGDYVVPRIINGSWQYAGGHGTVNRKEAIEALCYAADHGFVAYDCADIYTGVEELIGAFRAEYRNRAGTAKADRIKVHTKFVPDLAVLPTIDRAYVRKVIDRSLSRLGQERLDLVQYHWWDYDIPGYVRTAEYLAELQTEGKIDRIGTTNFDVPHLTELLDAGIPVTSNQIQCSLIDHRPMNGMLEFARQRDIGILCYGSLAGGFISDRFLDASRPVNPENRSYIKYGLVIEEFGGWELFQELLKTIHGIAEKHHVSTANIAARYVLDQPGVSAVIIAARNRGHIAQNTVTFSTELDAHDRKLIEGVLARSNRCTGDIYDWERQPGGKHNRIMKFNLNQA